MKSKATFGVVLCFVGWMMALTQEARGGAQAQQAPPTETVAPNIPGVVVGGTKVQVFTIGTTTDSDGPIALPDGNVIFTELGVNRIWKIEKDSKLSLFLDNTGKPVPGALGFDSKGRLIATQTTPPEQTKIAVIYPQGQEAVLAESIDGRPLGRPNDLVVSGKGGVYFTDPGVGKTPSIVGYIPPGGKAIKVADVTGRPNGIQLSPDEKTLYVNISWGAYLTAFDIQPDGTLRNGRNFGKYELASAKAAETIASWAGPKPVQVSDGLATDNDGRIYVANQSVNGVQVFSSQGQSLGTIPLGGRPQSIAFAGPEKKTLYVTGAGYLYKIQMLAQGPKGRVK